MGALALRLTGGAKRYHRSGREQTIFEGIDLELERGEIFALLGPSGCGKSTLLRTLAGLEPLSDGRVELGQTAAVAGGHASDGSADQAVRAVGIVFQDPLLLPWLTVAENVRLGLRYRAARGAAADAGESVAQILRDFGLADVARAYPDQLSGGQAQRASFARTVVTRPALLLLDEPFAALDPRTRAALQDWLLDVVRERHLTVLLVTHDVEEAIYLGDRVALMGSRPSTIIRSWDTAHGAAAGDGNGTARRRDDERLRAIRREVLIHYQTDVPAGTGPNWVI
ncbi:MAG TPA: ABC transporter ATP-binding protein [Chloroflexota bacterium]|nr:ABC transporter ATP-binding protein [Chloroflexota bacterium]